MRSNSDQWSHLIPRRVVTGHTGDGKATVSKDGLAPHARAHEHTPGMVTAVLWKTSPDVVYEDLVSADFDPTKDMTSCVPTYTETVALMVTFPPVSVYNEEWDPVAAGEEERQAIPGLAELFEVDAPGMHRTPSVDYGVVVRGEITLDLDGETTVLKQGDVVVQRNTRHAWRNLTDEPATIFFVLVGSPAAY